MKSIKLKMKFIVPVILLALTACSTAPKGELSSSANPTVEIEKLSAELNTAQVSNVDVLGRDEYLKSRKHLDQAKKDLAKGKKQEEIIDELRFAKQALRKAYKNAGDREEKAPGVFEARQNAIKSGANSLAELKIELNRIDEDLASDADEIDKISPENLDKFQARYVKLEKKSVIETQLGNAKSQINGARSDKAKKYTPKALRKAEISFNNAESIIGSNVSNTSGYEQAVTQANADALFLSEVTETVKRNGMNISEAAASKIVMQNRRISDLKENLTSSEGRIDEKNRTLAANETKLQNKDMALGEAQANIAIQNAMEESRQMFSSSEAEAYQQGGSLLIRLKSMNFQSGHSELPTESIALLAKVSEVAKSLNAQEIKIEGHTDSIGTSKINKALSEDRANTVAEYFKANGFEETSIKSEGYGFEKPISSNKSKSGRAQNRRVDIILTPDGSSTVRQ